MLQQGSGVIVNMASVVGLVGWPRVAGYAASKHGVVGLTKAPALEYARAGIRVNTLRPGFIRTSLLDWVIGADWAVSASPRMAGNDVAYFPQAVPGCLISLGCCHESRRLSHPHHSALFNEGALLIGV